MSSIKMNIHLKMILFLTNVTWPYLLSFLTENQRTVVNCILYHCCCPRPGRYNVPVARRWRGSKLGKRHSTQKWIEGRNTRNLQTTTHWIRTTKLHVVICFFTIPFLILYFRLMMRFNQSNFSVSLTFVYYVTSDDNFNHIAIILYGIFFILSPTFLLQ